MIPYLYFHRHFIIKWALSLFLKMYKRYQKHNINKTKFVTANDFAMLMTGWTVLIQNAWDKKYFGFWNICVYTMRYVGMGPKTKREFIYVSYSFIMFHNLYTQTEGNVIQYFLHETKFWLCFDWDPTYEVKYGIFHLWHQVAKTFSDFGFSDQGCQPVVSIVKLPLLVKDHIFISIFIHPPSWFSQTLISSILLPWWNLCHNF